MPMQAAVYGLRCCTAPSSPVIRDVVSNSLSHSQEGFWALRWSATCNGSYLITKLSLHAFPSCSRLLCNPQLPASSKTPGPGCWDYDILNFLMEKWQGQGSMDTGAMRCLTRGDGGGLSRLAQIVSFPNACCVRCAVRMPRLAWSFISIIWVCPMAMDTGREQDPSSMQYFGASGIPAAGSGAACG